MRSTAGVVTLLVGITCAFGAVRASAICQFPPEDENAVSFLPPRLDLQSGEGFASGFGVSTPGGLCTVVIDATLTEGARECGPLRWLRTERSGAGEVEEVELDLVRAGAQLGVFRIPEDATPDVHFAPFKDCDGGDRYIAPGCDVSTSFVVERDGPVVVSDDTRVRPPEPFDETQVCDDTPGVELPRSATGYSTTLIDLTVETEAQELLFDVWLLPRGAALPAEDEPRFIESRRVDVENMFVNQDAEGVGDFIGDVNADVLRFALDEPGAYDMHLRFTDPATGIDSDDYVIPVDTPAPEFQGCYCGAGSRADAASLVAFAALLWLRRRVASRGGQGRPPHPNG